MSTSSSYRQLNCGRRGRSRSSAIDHMFSADQYPEIGLPLDALPASDPTPSSFGRDTSFCDYSISDDTLFNPNQNTSSLYQSPGFDLPVDVLGHRFETSHRHTTRLDAIAFDFGCTPSLSASSSCINDVIPVERQLYFILPHQNFRNLNSERLVVGGSQPILPISSEADEALQSSFEPTDASEHLGLPLVKLSTPTNSFCVPT
ncbi:unnamed protein product [Dovyalis caffra]|uniref:Uncharacterized protein n=1 Tax=Dovyalis caffra TaxID=77055 RepID=A0AAV1QSJ9_9ROSI|nr:unnamed protein product [Dovyalis caffra]